jgi:hypothetical protein
LGAAVTEFRRSRKILRRPNDGAATILVIVGSGAFSLSFAPAEYSATAEIQADAKAAVTPSRRYRGIARA